MKNIFKNFCILVIIIIGGFVLKSIFADQAARQTPTPTSTPAPYSISSNSANLSFQPNLPVAYTFRIQNAAGEVLKDFQLNQGKFVHLITIRQDLFGFQDLHPAFNSQTGEFSLPNFSASLPGIYRIYFDFIPENAPRPMTLFEEVTVAGSASSQPLSSEDRIRTFEGYEVTLSLSPEAPAVGVPTTIQFQLKQDNLPVKDLQPYLGAFGHSVALKEKDLTYVRADPVLSLNSPEDGVVNFEVTFPEAGNYKIFSQFQHGGKVVATDYVVKVDN